MPYRIDSRVQNTHLGQHGYSGATAAVADAVIQEWHDNDSAFTSCLLYTSPSPRDS